MSTPAAGEHRVARLVRRALEHHGAAIEEHEGRWNVLLPAGLARELAAAEELVVALRPEDRRADADVLATLGGPFLEALLRKLLEGPAIHLQELTDGYLKKQGLKEAVERRFQFPNAKAVVSPGIEDQARYAVVHVQYQAQADRREEGLFALGLNERTLAILDDLPELFTRSNPAVRPPRDLTPPPLPDGVLEVIEVAAQHTCTARLAEFRKAVGRRCQRERERIQAYFAQMLEDHERRHRHRALTDEQRAASQEKALATARERDRKLADLDGRHSIQVRVLPVAVARLTMSVMSIPVTLWRGKAQVRTTLYWNPLLKEIEPLACGRCRGTMCSALVGGGGELLCKGCGEAAAKGRG